MNRRGFLGAILGAAMAPAVVRASSMMQIMPGYKEIESGLVVPTAQIVTGNQLLTIEQITKEAFRVLSVQMERASLFACASSLYEIQVGDLISIGT